MTFESFIARRYLSSKRKSLFVSFLLFITVLAVATGVFALIFVLSIMNGFEKDFRQRILGFRAPITVMSRTDEDLSGQVAKWQAADSRIWRVVPFVEGEAVVQAESDNTMGVRVRGIADKPDATRLGKLYESESFGEKSLVMGEELAEALQAHPDFTENLRLVFPLGEVGPTGDLVPRVRELTFTGVFRSGYYDFDNKYVLISYNEAMKLFGREARPGLEIWLKSPDDVQDVKRRLERLTPAGEVGPLILSWEDQNPQLFAAMKLEKIGMFLLLGILLLIASFNIFSMTSLTVLDKIKDMALLRTLGLSGRRVMRIFLLQAAGIGLLGVIIGGGLGLLTTYLFHQHPIPLPKSYYLEYLPMNLQFMDVFWVLVLAPLLTTLAALYPARQASKYLPVEVMRHE